MKKIFVLAILDLCISICSYSQVHQDSLIGSYAGESHYKINQTDPWTTTLDTFRVSGIPLGHFMDTTTCKLWLSGPPNYEFASPNMGFCWEKNGVKVPFYTEYGYCTSTINSAFYARFHSTDSLTAIADSNTLGLTYPYFCSQYFSVRFYGKWINNDIGVGINEATAMQNIITCPNPVSDKIYIEARDNTLMEINLFDIVGKQVSNTEKISGQIAEIKVGCLSDGIYFLKIITEKGVTTKKIVVQK